MDQLSSIVGFLENKTILVTGATGFPGKADMVVSSIIVAIAAHADRPGVTIYHIGSSSRNPLKLSSIVLWFYMYFSQNPLTSRDGKTVMVRRFKLLKNMKSFHKHMSLHYILPLKMLKLANIVSFHYFENFYSNAKRKIHVLMRMVELYKSYVFFKGIFDDKNTNKLRAAVKNKALSADAIIHFQFDPKTIKWEDYMLNIHFPGAVKHLLK